MGFGVGVCLLIWFEGWDWGGKEKDVGKRNYKVFPLLRVSCHGLCPPVKLLGLPILVRAQLDFGLNLSSSWVR
ncbi:hypothetical protein Pfo_008103 [Paulownia fortunei]|nr:hypothetical protein Pfo_008103 [Paulownia fortunei]